MAPDLIVYAIVAAGLVFWLRSILGAKHGDERERPNPFLLPGDVVEPRKDGRSIEGDAPNAHARITDLVANPGKVISVGNKNAEMGLIDISAADRNFDISFFLEGAQEAFVMIVEAFAKGEREILKDLLAEPVYKAFEGAIEAREKRKETQIAEILAVRKAEVIEAKLEGRMAYVTVRFRADETTVTKDENGAITAGHPERVHEMKDVWTFGRDTRARDPRWLVYQTRDDGDGDSEIIPNAQ